MYRPLFCCVALLFLAPFSQAQDRAFHDQHLPYTGLYTLDSGEKLIIGMIPEADILYLSRPENGTMRFLQAEEADAFSFGPTRSQTTPAAGQLLFAGDTSGAIQTLSLSYNGRTYRGQRSAYRVAQVSFTNGTEATLTGQIMTPPGTGPYPLAVIIPQSDRFDLWEVGTWLLAHGVSVLLYDQRNADLGTSTGPPVTGYYHEQQAVYATDAMAAVAFARTLPEVDARRVGVVGWSGGGWMGAKVAAEIPDLAFYVNIAGNASPGLDQAQHRFVSRLLREGFSDEVVAEAEAFLTWHHDVARGKAEWDAYAAERERVSDTAWYTYLTNRFYMTYDDLEDATTWGSAVAQGEATDDYARVTVPTLGLFFQYDQSSTPETPLLFHDALHRAGNGDYSIHVFPRTHHGGFKVDSYRFDTLQLTHRNPRIFRTLATWVLEHTIAAPHD